MPNLVTVPPELVEECEADERRTDEAMRLRQEQCAKSHRCLRSAACSKQQRHPGRCDAKRKSTTEHSALLQDDLASALLDESCPLDAIEESIGGLF